MEQNYKKTLVMKHLPVVPPTEFDTGHLTFFFGGHVGKRNLLDSVGCRLLLNLF